MPSALKRSNGQASIARAMAEEITHQCGKRADYADARHTAVVACSSYLWARSLSKKCKLRQWVPCHAKTAEIAAWLRRQRRAGEAIGDIQRRRERYNAEVVGAKLYHPTKQPTVTSCSVDTRRGNGRRSVRVREKERQSANADSAGGRVPS